MTDTQWEYKHEVLYQPTQHGATPATDPWPEMIDKLNALGSEGWELVQESVLETYNPNYYQQKFTTWRALILRRQKAAG